MRLIATVTWTFEMNVDEEVFKDWAEDGYNEEQVLKNEEQFMYTEVIDNIEGKIDNICLSNWSRDNVDMRWEEE